MILAFECCSDECLKIMKMLILQKEFSDRMYAIVREIKQNSNPHERSEKQKKNWITHKEIEDLFH